MASTVWKGQLTFGLVSFPVRLYPAARKQRVRLHYLRQTTAPAPVPEEPEADEQPEAADTSFSGRPVPPDEQRRPSAPLPVVGPPAGDEERTSAPVQVARVRQAMLSGEDAAPMGRHELLQGYEVAPHQYVTVDREELRRLRPATSPEMQILRSVRLSEIDPIYFETSYYVVPDRGGERPYALLFAALRKTEYVAIARVAMHGREHIIVIRPGHHGLLAHTMYYQDEVRANQEVPASTEAVTPKELSLATTFVEAIAGPFAPDEFKDPYREQLEALIESKQARREVSATSAGLAPAVTPPVDILEALKKSIALARKPAGKEIQVPRRAPGKVTEIPRKRSKRKA